MTVKDELTLAFSTAALILSALSFYFANLRVEDDLRARLVEFEVAEVDGADRSAPDAVQVRVVLINAGNRPAIVLGVDYEYSPRIDREDTIGGSVLAEKGLFPLLVLPRDIRVADIAVPPTLAIQNFHNVEPTDDPSTRDFACRLEFRSLDSRGRPYRATTPYFVWVHVAANGLRGSSTIDEVFPVALNLLRGRPFDKTDFSS
jgi:hypothetical protein